MISLERVKLGAYLCTLLVWLLRMLIPTYWSIVRARTLGREFSIKLWRNLQDIWLDLIACLIADLQVHALKYRTNSAFSKIMLWNFLFLKGKFTRRINFHLKSLMVFVNNNEFILIYHNLRIYWYSSFIPSVHGSFDSVR